MKAKKHSHDTISKMTSDEMFALSRDPANQRALKAAAHEAKLVGRMRVLYGKGPDGAVCGQCVHLIGMQYAKTYWKCRFGPKSHGPATDWRKRWQACGKFES